ncbi:uroporphyrin-III C-methyltransferase [Phenylobacterium haematophilum]|uniref:uroporphyrinogen-III C-methyltransferase n=1 Tax=Phenylobacterium haematophilum TaxID=98513 RepID=A0A839ZXE5_9CAUL|nr:uroporphyrinogen-III C-methyltransferase [Phenylobacterium haematophilum]MBB3889960.1 uroporphyrin-III C-methyltransferase [Phenylobacterium haematophilum]
MPHDPGRVLLVGAGPGAADLLTVRAARAVAEAQALLYDALVPQEILDLAPASCLKIQTGKRAGRTSMAQTTINRLMVRLARRGLDVVRLKGGDPSVFGRVGEEMAVLKAAGIEAQVIPGVTAAAAAAAQFGFPLTHRGQARRVVLTTARLDQGSLAEDWRAAADPEATLAIYMGGAAAGAIRDRLIAAGRSAATPILAVENAGRPAARLFTGVLGGLAETVPADLDGPVLIVVGDVAAQAVEAAPALTELAS